MEKPKRRRVAAALVSSDRDRTLAASMGGGV